AVVVQIMVDAGTAGVMFTRSPTTGDRSVVTIEGAWGLGSAVVGGEVTPDRWVLGKITGEISVREISDKLIQHVPAANGGVEDVAEITRLLEESEFDELHLEHEGFKLTLKRGAAVRREGPDIATASAVSPAPGSAAGPPGGELCGEPPGSPSSVLNVTAVTAPFVGIFYRAAKPGAPPYIEVGSQVEEDTIIGIIEVMKLMNTVRAEVRGTVVEILVQDGAVVEYAQVLVRIARGPEHG